MGACSELEDYLLKKLNKKSPHTKAKVLKILKYLIEKGHHGFRQDLQRRTDSIRNAMSSYPRSSVAILPSCAAMAPLAHFVYAWSFLPDRLVPPRAEG